MTTLSSLQKLCKELNELIAAKSAQYRSKVYRPVTWGLARRGHPQRGKCRKEHLFLQTFVPLNRRLEKFIQQSVTASQNDFDMSSSRFNEAPAILALVLFQTYIEEPIRVADPELLNLPLTAEMVRTNVHLQAMYHQCFLDSLAGQTLGELRASFVDQQSKQQALRATELNNEATLLEALLKRVTGVLSTTEHQLISQAVRKSYTPGQRAFLNL